MNIQARSPISFGWCSSEPATHAFITQNAINIIRKKNKGGSNILNDSNIETLKVYSGMPDKDEMSWLQDTHYYNIKNGRTIFWRKKTALKLFTQHALKAKELYKNNNPDLGMQELGRACHFLEDLSQPDHVTTTNPISGWLREKAHKTFEKYAGHNQEHYNYKPPEQIKTSPQKTYKNFLNDLGINTANEAAKYRKDIATKDKPRWDFAAETCINNGQNKVATFLARFLEEIKSVNKS